MRTARGPSRRHRPADRRSSPTLPLVLRGAAGESSRRSGRSRRRPLEPRPASRACSRCTRRLARDRKHIGRERVLEDKPEEVQARLRFDNSAVVQRLPVVAEHREIDPPARLEPGAPDDVCHLEDAIVLQHRQPVTHAYDPGHTLDAGRLEVFCSSDQRVALASSFEPSFRPSRVSTRHDARGTGRRESRGEPAGCRVAPGSRRPSGPPASNDAFGTARRRSTPSCRRRQGGRLPLQLGGIPVFGGVQLHDPRIELARVPSLRNPMRSDGDDTLSACWRSPHDNDRRPWRAVDADARSHERRRAAYDSR